MQTDEEIKKEAQKIQDYYFDRGARLNVEDWRWIKVKLHTLQEEYREQLLEKVSQVKIVYPEYESNGYDSGCKRTLEQVLTIIKNS